MKREELERIRVMAEEDQVSLLELARQLPALLRHIAEQGAEIERLQEACPNNSPSVCMGKRCIGAEAEDEIMPHVHRPDGSIEVVQGEIPDA